MNAINESGLNEENVNRQEMREEVGDEERRLKILNPIPRKMNMRSRK
jgi:hypothetical protein